MTEPPPAQYVESAEVFITTDEARLLRFLLVTFGYDKLTMLRDLLKDVIEDTGYGGIDIVIADKRVTLLKVEKSYR